jgi:hypothetical protein
MMFRIVFLIIDWKITPVMCFQRVFAMAVVPRITIIMYGRALNSISSNDISIAKSIRVLFRPISQMFFIIKAPIFFRVFIYPHFLTYLVNSILDELIFKFSAFRIIIVPFFRVSLSFIISIIPRILLALPPAIRSWLPIYPLP